MLENERFVQDQTKLIQMIATGEPFQEVLHYLLSGMEKQTSIQMYGSIMLYDPNRNQLTNGIGSLLPEEYIKAIQPMDVGPDEGSCGTAAYFKRTVIVLDIEDPYWNRQSNNCKRFGFKACWSIPIISSDKGLLGILALYFKESYEPSKIVNELLHKYSQLATIAIEVLGEMDTSKEDSLESDTQKKAPEDDKYIIDKLYKALDRSEFEIYYQPYFDVKTKELGMEALIRWNHPYAGLLAPASFLHIAERTGFILQIEEWVLTQSIHEATNLRENGLSNLTLSVNISAQQFDNPKFPTMVAKALKSYSFDPKNLTLEVTERFLIKQDNIKALNRLKKSGVRISIDDFGTSYSSLQYLRDLNIDELKIDRSFISNMDTNLNNQKIVEMIILLGHQLDLNIVAEGVETEKQFKLLEGMNCDRVQGFLFSKPLPLKEFKRKYA